ncbi:unnamed protein product [Arabis nemorensis]|uniref:Uncharacterized protein n=1 Tax=Arabis nemorensis TaxID=586526 RepID=A0A565BL09_9BRAS|nr:unnamed protein product [Arabis nemorensis]
MGRTESVPWRLGYQGGSGCDREGHICNDRGTGYSKNVKTSMAACEMKTHTSSGSYLAAEKLKGIQKPNKGALRRARRRKQHRKVNPKSHGESHNKFGGTNKKRKHQLESIQGQLPHETYPCAHT